MKTNLKSKVKVYSMSVVLLISVALAGIFMQSCTEDKNEDYLDNDIINSLEMEEYVIASSDLKHSLAIFEKEISKVDFSKLEISYDKNDKKRIGLPATSVGSVGIEDKIQIFNEKKEVLLKKYPQLASFNLEMNKKYIQQCIKNSLNLSGRLLELGINYSQPRLKGGTVENYYGEDWYMMTSFMSIWMNIADYVELLIVAYADGSYTIWIDDKNDEFHSHITLRHHINTNTYTFSGGGNSSTVIWIAHTHKYSSSPSDADIDDWGETPGLTRYIYYQDSFYDFF
ncbi:MAG: hypothetical protein LBO74_07625 [Candidatus Symbiothrix sp.]|jgi:hypothetical protein|nr:hypothetical protein [Candidatus Symbiothrix sp.]